MKNDKSKQFRYIHGNKVDDRYSTYFEFIVHDDDFIKEVKKIRAKFNIPPDGIEEFPTHTDSKDYDEIVDSTDFDIPKVIQENELFWDEIVNLCSKFYFDEDSWFTVMSEFVVFDMYNPFIFGKGHIVYNLDTDIKRNMSFSKAYAKTHPVAILIDPYTSLSELRDLISNVYKSEIQPIQKKTFDKNNKITKLKKTTSKMVPIYEFIKNNLHLSSIELTGKINTKFKLNWDYTRVDKIIRDKKYRRKS